MAGYSLSVLGLLVLAAVILILSPIVAPLKRRAGIAPGGLPEGGYDNGLYRLDRTYQNAVENFAIFAVPALLAMMLGIGQGFLALLVWIHVAARLVYNAMYLRKIGAPIGGIRTMVFAVGWLVNIVLVLAVAWAAL